MALTCELCNNKEFKTTSQYNMHVASVAHNKRMAGETVIDKPKRVKKQKDTTFEITTATTPSMDKPKARSKKSVEPINYEKKYNVLKDLVLNFN